MKKRTRRLWIIAAAALACVVTAGVLLSGSGNGYEKTIVGFHVVPDRGEEFADAVKEFCGYSWGWYSA